MAANKPIPNLIIRQSSDVEQCLLADILRSTFWRIELATVAWIVQPSSTSILVTAVRDIFYLCDMYTD
jgi:hypothetical protein